VSSWKIACVGMFDKFFKEKKTRAQSTYTVNRVLPLNKNKEWIENIKKMLRVSLWFIGFKAVIEEVLR
jgi:hypothetical protein